jgi:hypothetical protein
VDEHRCEGFRKDPTDLTTGIGPCMRPAVESIRFGRPLRERFYCEEHIEGAREQAKLYTPWNRLKEWFVLRFSR